MNNLIILSMVLKSSSCYVEDGFDEAKARCKETG